MNVNEYVDNLPTHILKIFDGSEIELISVVRRPAIGVEGIAMSSIEDEYIQFSSNDEKMQIVAPILITDTYPKQKNKAGEPYQIHITEETVRDAHKQFAKRGNTRVFNLEHSEMMLDGYILESYIVDTPEQYAVLNDKYGIKLSTVSWIGVMQFEDREQYLAMKKAGASSFSIEGPIASEIISKNKINMSNKFTGSFHIEDGKLIRMNADSPVAQEEAEKIMSQLKEVFDNSEEAEKIKEEEEVVDVEASTDVETAKDEVADAIEDKVDDKVEEGTVDAVTADVIRDIIQEVVSNELEFIKTKLMDMVIEKDEKKEEEKEDVQMSLNPALYNLINSRFN